jgi:hypothetical protein
VPRRSKLAGEPVERLLRKHRFACQRLLTATLRFLLSTQSLMLDSQRFILSTQRLLLGTPRGEFATRLCIAFLTLS